MTQNTTIHAETSEESEKINQEYLCYKDGKQERTIFETLVKLSDRLLEDDQKSLDCFIGGWEGAVCGWGSVSPNDYLHPQRKLRRPKSSLDDVNCLICLDMCNITDWKSGTSDMETFLLCEKDKEESIVLHTDVLPADVTFGNTDHCLSGVVFNSKTDSDNVSTSKACTEEQRPRIQSSPGSCTTSVVEEMNVVPVTSPCLNYYSSKDLLLTPPVVLPPLKTPTGTLKFEPIAKNKFSPVHQLEKLPSRILIGNSVYSPVVGNIELKGERVVEPVNDLHREQVKYPHSLSFLTSCIPKTPDNFYLQYALLANKLSLGPSDLKQNCNPTSVGFLHTRTLQNKRNTKQDFRHLGQVRLRGEAKSKNNTLLEGPLLPLLTVSRVAGPLAHRPL
ncbi:hypothetical protein GDO86_008377 [Hymenochirus boettgeri]|uniref:Uncharacterized protein n=1 Tax=Hymenochirus boettgeri TaxID=247094 RepID=A0A8T2J5F8_9PIPI|nr:hypothetical protein GDO86_008377 [Hymenochirus boettgeri]